MVSRTLRILLVCLVASATVCLADSARDMLASGRIDEAIAELNRRLSSASDADSSNLLCRAYYALGDWDRAESSCRKAVSLDPGNGRFHLWLGRVYGEKADRANFLTAANLAGKVRTEFERAVQLAPNDVDSRLDLAEFYAVAPGIVGGGEQKARAQAQSIARLNPAREHWVYARIAEKNQDLAGAEREYQQMISSSHGDSDAWLNLAIFYRHQKRFDEMEQTILKASQAPMSKRDVLVDLAHALYRSGRNFPFAIQLLKRYLTTGPVEQAPAFKAHYLLGTLLETQGDKASATEEYRASLSLARQYGLAQQALNRLAR